MSETTQILQLSALWQQALRGREGRLALGVVLGAVMVGAELARRGTLPARAAALGCIVLTVALAWWVRRARRRRLLAPEGVIRTVIRPVDAELADRALRASALLDRTEKDPSSGSLELSRLHLHRVLSRVPLSAVERRARSRAARLRWGFRALLLGLLTVFAVAPFRPIEGLDVLFARKGVAPMSLEWLHSVRVTIQPPAYLRMGEQDLFLTNDNQLPAGSVVSVRGSAERRGRKLVLTDGQREVGFVDDGSGSLVARWNLKVDTVLWVAARFGEVLIPEAGRLSLVAVPDAPPSVELENAPRSVELRDAERIEFRYEVEDDHGLRELNLVLRSGAREDRRVLGKFDGQTRLQSGAHALSVRDPFLRRMFLPVIATLEARDNDASNPDKWGRSAAVTILPPAVGEPQALRYKTFESARDGLLDLLDYQLTSERLRKSNAPRAELTERDREQKRLKSGSLQRLRDAASATYAGLKVSPGLVAFVNGQARALDLATGTTALRRSEDVILALDAGLRALGQRDAEEVSKRLGDVAEEVAEAAKLMRSGEKRGASEQRLEVALTALAAGTKNLVTLGALGADIGSVAQGETRRIRRALTANSHSDAELAARHLAARLRRPKPSFGSASSSGGGGGGVESGRGNNEAPGEASDADKQFDQLARELSQLAAEHAQQIRDVEQALQDAEQGKPSEEAQREAREHAEQLRRRLEALPEPGAMPGSARAAAAMARERMSAMAQQLERMSLKEGVESGRLANSELGEAAELSKDPRTASDWLEPSALTGAREALSGALAFAERALQQQRDQTAERAAKALEEASAREENLARRAGNLASRGEHSEAKLPDDVRDSLERAENAMRQAARELSSRRGEPGLELQQEAQRLLERANPSSTDQEDDGKANPESGEGEDGESSRKGQVPPAEKARRAEEFRRRVLEGLSKDRRGRLSDAVTRYAEGLLE